MPGLNGLQTVDAIRSGNWGHQGVPILALSGNSNGVDMEAALRAGVNDYIVKSGDMELLRGKILKVLAVAK